jgi:ribosome maturation factor RimP
MSKEMHIGELEMLVQGLLEEDPTCFLVDLAIKPTNNIKIYLDSDSGLSIDKCVQINRKLYRLFEEKGLFPDGNFSLEVSSPGLDEPLKLHRQFVRHTGRPVHVVLKDGTVKEGVMKQVEKDFIVVSEEKGKNKKKEIVEHIIPFEHVKTTKIQIVF